MVSSAPAVLATAGSPEPIRAAVVVVYLAVLVLVIASLWKVFTKAGRPGWAAIIPFYNVYVLLKVAGRPGWWFLLLLIPLVNVVVALIVNLDLARQFGRGVGFGLGLFFLGLIFLPILAFGAATYRASGSVLAPAPTQAATT